MKKCPICNQMFGDENDFCLNDGTQLVAQGSTQETVFVTTPASTGQPFHGQSNVGGPPSGRNSQFLVFGLILLLSIVAVGFGVAYFTSSGKGDNKQLENVGNGNANSVVSNEEQKRLDEKQAQVDADNLRLSEERKRLDADRKKLEIQKQSVGPMPLSTSAIVIDPPTNIRRTPNGAVQCVVSSRMVIGIIMSPGIADKRGVWYRTTACGGSHLVHSSQISFN